MLCLMSAPHATRGLFHAAFAMSPSVRVDRTLVQVTPAPISPPVPSHPFRHLIAQCIIRALLAHIPDMCVPPPAS